MILVDPQTSFYCMEYLSEKLREQYEFEANTFAPSDYCEGDGLSESDVLKAHYILSDYFMKKGEAVSFGVLKYDMLASAVSRQYVEFSGEKKWKDDFLRCASLLYGLTLDHAFHDGNKRTALLSSLWYLNKVHREVNDNAIDYLENLVVDIASRALTSRRDFKYPIDDSDSEVLYIAQKLKSWTRYLDKRMYTLTFSELDSRLKQFGFYLGDPSGNQINVYKKGETVLKFWEKKDKRICKIGFPSMKEQVSAKDLRYLLKETGLNSSAGIDSSVFFKGATPSYELLQQYNEPLKRLKDS